ncbi:precorrin-3B C(17)-methyltransferase [Corynebacterium sp. 335C]
MSDGAATAAGAAAPGTFHGVGLGPGDPELVTLRAARVLREADVIAYHSSPRGRSTARTIMAGLDIDWESKTEELLVYPVTVGGGDDYAERMAAFYADATERLAAHLRVGRSVAVASLGDPMLYSSCQHLHRALSADFPAELVPGVTSVTAAACESGHPLAEGAEILTVLPATADPARLAAAAAAADCLVVMKLGGHVGEVRAALAAAGKLDRALVVARASMDGGWTRPLAEVAADEVPYFAVAVVGTASRGYGVPRDDAHRPGSPDGSPGDAGPVAASGGAGASGADAPAMGEVVVVGLGPGPSRWMTPEATAQLARATDVVGYSTYVRRVPARPGLKLHASDNRVEAERAAMALDLARRGARVAVVSSGDAGVFAMAAAVLEVADDDAFRDVPVRVVPGMTAAQAVASRVGAPLGHDFAMLSLSDRLKPWDVVERRVEAVAAADMAFAVYNPASKSRRHQVGLMRDVVLRHRAPETPVVVARAVGAPEEDVLVTTLGELDPDVVDMRTMLIVGASTTAAYEAGDGTTRVYTSRRYGTGTAG